ncbi:hypothetical protein PSHT_10259 [Puccinia striiformis]|uniref:Uncharacterized protein n=1 Tax=Puccinia striiformis TaxID=27350 RepID=A0A2S4VBA1_9BASI|nr:hypothetical protein PSHT_10259 [Puccinia striiformis]
MNEWAIDLCRRWSYVVGTAHDRLTSWSSSPADSCKPLVGESEAQSGRFMIYGGLCIIGKQTT